MLCNLILNDKIIEKTINKKNLKKTAKKYFNKSQKSIWANHLNLLLKSWDWDNSIKSKPKKTKKLDF
jgi:hypothetical protein